MKLRTAAATAIAVVALTAGCTATPAATPPPATQPVRAAVADTSWAPIGMVHVGTLAWQWTPKDAFRCQSHQDGCVGITVATRDGCPRGIYIELALTDSSGSVVDKANEITAGLRPGATAKAVLSPPTGVPAGAEAQVSRLNCL